MKEALKGIDRVLDEFAVKKKLLEEDIIRLNVAIKRERKKNREFMNKLLGGWRENEKR